MKLSKLMITGFTLLSFFTMQLSYGMTFNMPVNNNCVLGHLQKTRVGWGDNFHTIGRRFDIGFDAMVAANPEFYSNELPLFYHVLIPAEFIIPPGPHKGIILNLAQKRLFYFDKKTQEILTFPVAIGKVGWPTPIGTLHIIQKIKNPTWYAPKSILKALAKEGFKNVPPAISSGPQDPLGDYAMRLSRSMYLMHGTNDPASIGTQASSGCIRLFPENIDPLFHAVPVGTLVRIVDDPYLLGWKQKELYLAVYPGLKDQKPLDLSKIEDDVRAQTKGKDVQINWRTVAYLVLNKNGIPEPIGTTSA